MGSCYSITLHMKTKGGAEPALVSTLQEFTSRMNPSNPEMTKDTLEGLVRMIFSGWTHGRFVREEKPDGWTDIEADFDACYSWESTMREAFGRMAPCLEDGSSLYIEPDNESETLVVTDGKAFFTS